MTVKCKKYRFHPICAILDWMHRREKHYQSMEDRIMTKLSELATILNGIDTKLDKAKDEILAQIAALEAALTDVEIPTDAQTALDNLSNVAQSLDDIVPG